MTDLQGAVGIVQTSNGSLIEEDEVGECSTEELRRIPWLSDTDRRKGYRHGRQAYVCYVDESESPCRKRMMQASLQRGISTPAGDACRCICLGLDPEKTRGPTGESPVARDCDRYTMAIPLHNRMRDEDFGARSENNQGA